MEKELRTIIKTAVIILSVMVVFGWIGSRVETYIGLIIGGIVSIVNFLLSYRDALAIVKGGVNPKRIKISGYVLRYMILLITMVVLMNFDEKSFFASIAGFFLIRVVIYIREIYKFLRNFINNNK